MFKKKRLPQKGLLFHFKQVHANCNLKKNWFVSSFFFAWRVSIFFKWILRLKFILKKFRYKFLKIQVAPLLVRLKFLKTKNSRMGKGKGGSKSFFIFFFAGSPLFRFKEKTFYFFFKFLSFLKKFLTRTLTFLF